MTRTKKMQTVENKTFRVILEDLGMSRKNLADAMDVSLAAVDHWVAGRHAPPSHRRLLLADCLDLTMDQLRAVLATTKAGFNPPRRHRRRAAR